LLSGGVGSRGLGAQDFLTIAAAASIGDNDENANYDTNRVPPSHPPHPAMMHHAVSSNFMSPLGLALPVLIEADGS
jgi:hypothetical protein